MGLKDRLILHGTMLGCMGFLGWLCYHFGEMALANGGYNLNAAVYMSELQGIMGFCISLTSEIILMVMYIAVVFRVNIYG